jgi:hypothetical protein
VRRTSRRLPIDLFNVELVIMTPEEVWRMKNDDELFAASNRLSEYTEVGQQAIVAELERRRSLGLISDIVTTDVRADTDDSDLTSRRDVDIQDGVQNGVLISLWRGDVPLWRVYWVCGVLTNFLWLVVIALAAATNIQLLEFVLVVLNVIYSLFIMVAIWRSAGRYAGNRIWGDLARVSVALGLLRAVGDAFVRR